MAVTMKDIRDIIEGSALEIAFPNPIEPDLKWYIRQPEDWEMDLAAAVRAAAISKGHEQVAVKEVDGLPPSAGWIARQAAARKQRQDRIQELEALGSTLDPLQALELENERSGLENMVDPATFTRADEIVASYARKRHEEFLVTRLVFSEKGTVYFDPDSREGPKRWKKLKVEQKALLFLELYKVFQLEITAKN